MRPASCNLNTNPLPGVVLIRIDQDHTIAHCAWGLKRAWHARARRLSIVSMLLWGTHCVPQIWRGRYCSSVEVWPLEINVHTWICSTQCSVNAINVHFIRIEFAFVNSVTEPVLNPDSVRTGLYINNLIGKATVWLLVHLNILCSKLYIHVV